MTQKRVKFCPRDVAHGAEKTVLEFKVVVHLDSGSETDDEESPLLAI